MCIVVHQNLQDEVLDERDGVRCLLFQIQEPVDVVDQVFGAHSIELSEKCFEVAVYGIETLDIIVICFGEPFTMRRFRWCA